MALARRQLLHEPLKLALALIGVVLAVCLAMLLLGLQEGITRQASTYEDNAGADVYVGASDARTFATPGAATLPASAARELRSVPGVADAAAIENTLAVLKLHGKRVATLLIGFDPGRLGGPWKMASGRAPRQADEITVDRVMAEAHGLRLGAMVQLRDREFRVVGLSDRTASWMTPLLFAPRRSVNALQRQGDRATFLLVRTRGRDPQTVARDISARTPGMRATSRAQLAQRSRDVISRDFSPTLRAMVAIALGIGTLVIGLTAYGFIAERRREFGALKAIGARNASLYRVVCVQAVAIAAAGLLGGLVLAKLAAWGIHATWPKFQFVSLPGHYVLLTVSALGMGLIGALVPARLLARLDPAEVFRA